MNPLPTTLPPHTAKALDTQLREAHTYIGRLMLFVMRHDLAEEWSREIARLKARDAAERARGTGR